jgi:glycosyltransferase involved in cell wall biosynthesis
VFTQRLAEGLRQKGFRAEITWLPHHAEYAPWVVSAPRPPAWANIAHVNTWLHRRFLPRALPIVATTHHCVHDKRLRPYKSRAQDIYHRLWIKPLEKTVLNRAKKIVAVSRYTAERTRATFSIPGIRVVHNGIDLDGEFQPATHRQMHYPFRLLYVGNWSTRKGVDLLKPIMEILGPGFELRYTADHKELPRSISLPKNMHRIDRPPTVSALAEVYRDADALLFPSRLEGFGLVALEAQTCGVPVIATHGSALPEVVEDGVTGLLCPADDLRAFAAAARRLASDRMFWHRLVVTSRDRVKRLFTMDAMLEKYIDVYLKLLNLNSP